MFNDLGPKLTELIIKKAPQDMPTVAAYNKQTGLLVKSANKEINKAFNQIKFELDVWYVDHWSVWLDILVLFKTVAKVITREGINQPGNATSEEFKGTPDPNAPAE